MRRGPAGAALAGTGQAIAGTIRQARADPQGGHTGGHDDLVTVPAVDVVVLVVGGEHGTVVVGQAVAVVVVGAVGVVVLPVAPLLHGSGGHAGSAIGHTCVVHGGTQGWHPVPPIGGVE